MAVMAAILDIQWHDFSYFLIYKSHQCLLPRLESIGLSVQEKKLNIDFQDRGHGGHQKDFSYFWSTSHPNASY